MKLPEFKTKKELFSFLVENKETLIAQKKATFKKADGVLFIGTPHYKELKDTVKTIRKAEDGNTDLTATLIINTTNLLDSHYDVHINGLWSKSLKENRNIMHLKEHSLTFADIIADGKDLEAYTQNFTFKELGYPELEGNTEALVFRSTITEERQKFMYNQYKKGRVKNHSVGMYYVKIVLAINDEDYGAEFEAWQKYYPQVANKDRADELGFFYAVKEAKVVEGSAVPIGSNYATPTHEINTEEPDDKATPKTKEEPVDTTPKTIELNKYLQTFKFFEKWNLLKNN